MTAHYLPPSLPDAAAAYIESMPPGHVELFSLAPLDRTGVPVWNVLFLPADGRTFVAETPHGVGYGSTDDEAIIGATGELAEAVHSARGLADLPVHSGSFSSLRARYGARGIADPLTLCLPAGSMLDHETVTGLGAGDTVALRSRCPGADRDGGLRQRRFARRLHAIHNADHQRAWRRPYAGLCHRPWDRRIIAARRKRAGLSRHGPWHRARFRGRRTDGSAHTCLAGPIRAGRDRGVAEIRR